MTTSPINFESPPEPETQPESPKTELIASPQSQIDLAIDPSLL